MKGKNHCLRESSRTRTLLAWESSEQPSTASIPHIFAKESREKLKEQILGTEHRATTRNSDNNVLWLEE